MALYISNNFALALKSLLGYTYFFIKFPVDFLEDSLLLKRNLPIHDENFLQFQSKVQFLAIIFSKLYSIRLLNIYHFITLGTNTTKSQHLYKSPSELLKVVLVILKTVKK